MKILKQVAGIDVAQKELVVSFGRLQEDLSVELPSSKVFPNTQKGHNALIDWVRKISDADAAVQFVMEATGVYHESLAYFLVDRSYNVVVVLPNKISNYFRTLQVKTINDYTAAEAIARFGLERKLDNWQKPDPVLKKFRQLCRERDQIIDTRTITKNQLHAENAGAEPNAGTIARFKQHIALLNKQVTQVKGEIEGLIKSKKDLTESVKLMTTIPGVGVLTAATVIAETNGFELIRNKKQLTSYAGLDVREKQSGTSIKGKPTISKRGNRYLRKALHLPALAAIRCDSRFKSVFVRLVEKHGIKMKAVVAVQRKLLEMTYTIYKTKTPYNLDFEHKKREATGINA
jgi:transposase